MSLGRLSFVTLMVSAFVAVSGSAQAANVLVGNPQLNTSKYSTGCQGLYEEMCTFLSLELPKSSGLVQSPVNGAIVRWGIRGATNVPGYAIRALKSQGGLEFTGDGTSERVTPTGSAVETFGASLPIEAGEFVGLDVPPGGGLAMNKVPGTAFGFFGDLINGSTQHTGSFEGELAYFAEIQPAPTITEVTPSAGPATGGSVVKVSGTDFRGVSTVRFGTVPATSINVESETSLEAVAPPATAFQQLVDVSVATVAGTSASTFHDLFEYVPVSMSSAPRVCVVPRIKGLRFKAAGRRARRADCGIKRTRDLWQAKGGTGFVVKQRPVPGKTVPEGTKIVVKLR